MPDEQVNPGIRGRHVERPGAVTVRTASGLARMKPSQRWCPCGNPLNSYNPGPDCNACKKAERDELFGGDV